MTEDRAYAGQKRHDPALDGVRGLAISLVLVHHLLGIGNDFGNPVLHWIAEVQASTWVGVDLFFALSGFLITGILWESLGGRGYFRVFYIRRSLRISPLYFGVLLALGVLTPLLRLNWHRHFAAFFFYFQNVGFLPRADNYSISPQISLAHFWSLAIEEQVYLVWPLCIFVLRRAKPIMSAAVAGAACSLAARAVFLWIGAPAWMAFTCTPCRLDAILLGSALAIAIRSGCEARVYRAAPIVFWLAAASLAGMSWGGGLLWRVRPMVLTVGISVVAVACTALIAWTQVPESNIRKPLSWPVLRFLGRYSYGIYVFHFLTADWGITVLRHRLVPILHSRIAAGLCASTVYLAGSIALAWISFHFYERRFLRLKRLFVEPKQPADGHQLQVTIGG